MQLFSVPPFAPPPAEALYAPLPRFELFFVQVQYTAVYGYFLGGTRLNVAQS